MKLCFVFLLILIPTLSARQSAPMKDSTPSIYVITNRITNESNYLFGEFNEFDTSKPSHPNYGKLSSSWTNTNGWDIFMDSGTPVYSITEGIVVYTRFRENGRTVWGYNLMVDAGNNSIFYTHLDTVLVKEREKVKQGQLIGYVGEWPENYTVRGKKMPSHLHIALAKGKLDTYLDSGLYIIPKINHLSMMYMITKMDK